MSTSLSLRTAQQLRRLRKQRRSEDFMTTAEYLATPETVLPRKLAYGVMRVAEAPRTRHQRAVFRIARALAAHVEREGLGEVLQRGCREGERLPRG